MFFLDQEWSMPTHFHQSSRVETWVNCSNWRILLDWREHITIGVPHPTCPIVLYLDSARRQRNHICHDYPATPWISTSHLKPYSHPPGYYRGLTVTENRTSLKLTFPKIDYPIGSLIHEKDSVGWLGSRESTTGYTSSITQRVIDCRPSRILLISLAAITAVQICVFGPGPAIESGWSESLSRLDIAFIYINLLISRRHAYLYDCQIYDRVAFCNKLLTAGSPFEQHDVWNTEVTGPRPVMGSPSQLLFIYLPRCLSFHIDWVNQIVSSFAGQPTTQPWWNWQQTQGPKLHKQQIVDR
jgi:hypothetical protein